MALQVVPRRGEQPTDESQRHEPTVTIHFTDPSRAVTITPDDPLYQGEEITMLLMPMLVNE